MTETTNISGKETKSIFTLAKVGYKIETHSPDEFYTCQKNIQYSGIEKYTKNIKYNWLIDWLGQSVSHYVLNLSVSMCSYSQSSHGGKSENGPKCPITNATRGHFLFIKWYHSWNKTD